MPYLQISYKNNKLKKICENYDYAKRSHGDNMAHMIFKSIQEIEAIDSIDNLVKFQIGRCHSLKGDRKNEYAMDLVHPYRLIFEKKGNNIEVAHIKEITDYH